MSTQTIDKPTTQTDTGLNSLSDLIRLGSMTTEQSTGWGCKEGEACALSAAGIAAEQLGLI